MEKKENMKTIKYWTGVAFFIALIVLSSMVNSCVNEPIILPETTLVYPVTPLRHYTVFNLVESITGTPEALLYGIMMTESDGYLYVVGDGGKSKGRTQLNEDFRKEREEMCGYVYDPFDEFDSIYLCGLIMRKNRLAFYNQEHQIAAYRQGIAGVRSVGPTGWYVDRVIKNIKNKYDFS